MLRGGRNASIEINANENLLVSRPFLTNGNAKTESARAKEEMRARQRTLAKKKKKKSTQQMAFWCVDNCGARNHHNRISNCGLWGLIHHFYIFLLICINVTFLSLSRTHKPFAVKLNANDHPKSKVWLKSRPLAILTIQRHISSALTLSCHFNVHWF